MQRDGRRQGRVPVRRCQVTQQSQEHVYGLLYEQGLLRYRYPHSAWLQWSVYERYPVDRNMITSCHTSNLPLNVTRNQTWHINLA